MEKKDKVGKNVSSGAEKVENVVKTKKGSTKKSLKKPAKKSQAKKRADMEKARAKKREELALKKEERKAKREQAKAERKKMLAQRKAEREKRNAERKAKKLAYQEKQRERKHQIALQKKEARLKRKQQRLEEKSRRRQKRTPGIGGWLAAVISLGAVCLTLTAIVTYETMGIKRFSSAIQSGYGATMYEFIGNFDEIDNDLNKVRVSSGKEEQSELLTNILLESRLAEASLEKLPLSSEQDERLTTFINRTGYTARRLLNKIAQGGTLDEKDVEKLEELYDKCHKARASIDGICERMNKKELSAMMKGKSDCSMRKAIKEVENTLKQEDYEKMLPPQPREDKITSSQAEELLKSYFSDYDLKKVEFAGETLARSYTAYNFICHDKNGVRLFAEIASDGSLVGFDYFKNCTKQNFDTERSMMIASDFLAKLGYESMDVVFASESGAEVEFEYAYTFQGAICYADNVRVKVCKERGIVVGMDASRYLRHHKDRQEWKASVSMEEAQKSLNDKLSVLSSSVVFLPHKGKEVPAYEFVCEYDENEYYVYVSAQTGKEIAIFLVEATSQGKFMR